MDYFLNEYITRMSKNETFFFFVADSKDHLFS